MKRITMIFLAVCMAFALGACAGQPRQEPVEENPESVPQDVQATEEILETDEMPEKNEVPESRVLIVYYSYSGVTKGVSEMLQEKTGGDIFELVPENPYSDDMYEASDRAEEELESGELPELTGELPDLSEYDFILIGGPVWSEKAAPPLAAYLSQTDFGGKVVVPFWTYNSNEGAYEEDVTGYIQNAEIRNSLGLAHASSMEDSELGQALEQWLEAVKGVPEMSSVQGDGTAVTLTIGGREIHAVLNDSPQAKEFQEMLPLTIPMTRMGEHEYYGSLPQPLTHTEELQTGYTVGDLAFWTPGDLFALYFDEPEDAPEGLMILGRITSDLAVFDQLGNSEEVRMELSGSGVQE